MGRLFGRSDGVRTPSIHPSGRRTRPPVVACYPLPAASNCLLADGFGRQVQPFAGLRIRELIAAAATRGASVRPPASSADRTRAGAARSFLSLAFCTESENSQPAGEER